MLKCIFCLWLHKTKKISIIERKRRKKTQRLSIGEIYYFIFYYFYFFTRLWHAEESLDSHLMLHTKFANIYAFFILIFKGIFCIWLHKTKNPKTRLRLHKRRNPNYRKETKKKGREIAKWRKFIILFFIIFILLLGYSAPNRFVYL